MRTSTITLAAASAPGTAWRRSNAAPTTSPPTCATGKRTLTASRTNLNPRQVPSCGRTLAGKSSHQPAPATRTVTARTTTTSRIPQPTLETAWPTEPTPDQTVSATIAAMPANQAATPACLTIATPSPLPTTFSQRPLSAPRTQNLGIAPRSGPIGTNAGALPRRFDVESVRCPKPNRQLVGRAPLGHQRRTCGIAAEPFVLEEGVRRPLRRPLVARLRACSEGANAALGVEYRQSRGRRLCRGDAEIWAERRGGRKRKPRATGQRPSRADRDDRVHENIANDPVVAAEALPHLGARAQPRNPPIFREEADPACPGDIAKAPQRRGFHVLPAPPRELADRADLEIASLDQADAEAVPRTTERLGRAIAVNREDRIGPQAILA